MKSKKPPKKTGREGRQPLTLYIEDELHRSFKIACAEDSRPMTRVVEALILAWLEGKAKV